MVLWMGDLHSETYTVGVEQLEYLPHYSYPEGEYKGIARDILDAFASKNGITFHYKAYPISRLYSTFLGGELDFKYPDNPVWATDAKTGLEVIYSDPVVEYIDGLMVLPGRKGRFVPDEIKTIGTFRGFTPVGYTDRIQDHKIRLEEVNSMGSLMQMVLRGRVDGAYMNVLVARYQLRHVLKEPGALVHDDALPSIKDHFYLSTLKQKDVISKFNLFLSENREWINSIESKYLASQSESLILFGAKKVPSDQTKEDKILTE